MRSCLTRVSFQHLMLAPATLRPLDSTCDEAARPALNKLCAVLLNLLYCTSLFSILAGIVWLVFDCNLSGPVDKRQNCMKNITLCLVDFAQSSLNLPGQRSGLGQGVIIKL